MYRFWILSCFAFWIFLLSSINGAFASPLCGDRDEIVQDLTDKYQEQQVGIGIDHTGRLVEVWASLEGGYTIIATSPGGPTCLVSVGKSWQMQAPKPDLPGRGA